MSDWASVEERLPEERNIHGQSANYLVIDDWGNMAEAWLDRRGWINALSGTPDDPIDVTHWMPLPEPPK